MKHTDEKWIVERDEAYGWKYWGTYSTAERAREAANTTALRTRCFKEFYVPKREKVW